VCDEVGPGGRIVATTVVGGATVTPPMAPGAGMLLADEDGLTWLLSAGRRHRTDLGDDRLAAVYGLVGARPRAVSGALLAVLPEGPALSTPAVTGRGGLAPRGVPGRVGDVLVARPAGGPPRYFAVLSGGLQQVPEVVAELLRMASVARAFHPVPLELAVTVPAVEELPVAGWPAPSPRLLTAEHAPLLCWGWVVGGPAGGVVSAGAAVPVPTGTEPVPLPRADGAGPQLDAVAVGAGGVVRAAGSGAWWLVSAVGVGYPVLDAETVAALGGTAAEPAPDAVLTLIPTGTPLTLDRTGPGGN
jgi:type VII secretion protein EccB